MYRDSRTHVITAYLREPTLITRQGKAVAVLVSVEDWEDYLRLKKELRTREAEAVGFTGQSLEKGADAANGSK